MPKDTAPPVIRPIVPADEPVWRELWRDYLAFYHTTLPDTVYDATFARLTSDDLSVNGFLALENNVPVGLVHFIFHPHFWRPEGICYLQDLFVAPGLRGKGVARALIGAVYAAADAAKVPGVYWLTQEFNYKGRMLYDQVAEKSPFIHYRRRTS